MLVACSRCQARSWATGPGCAQPQEATAPWAMLNAPQIQVSEAVEEKGSLRMPRGKKHKNKLSVQLLILRFSFCCCAGRYKQSEHQGADDNELSQFLPVSCTGSEGWLKTRLPSTNTQHWKVSKFCFWQPWGCPSLHFLPSPYCSGRNNSHWWITKRKQHFLAVAEGYETTFLLQSIPHRSINLIKEKTQLFKITAQQLFCLFCSNSSMNPPRCLPLQNSGYETLLG